MTEPPNPPPAASFWRDVVIGPERLWRLGLAFWGGVLLQIALARQGGISLSQNDPLVAVWVLVLGLVVGLYVRGQRQRTGQDLALVPLLLMFTLPANLAETILTAPDLHGGWKAVAAGAAAFALWRLRDLAVLRGPARQDPDGQD